MNFTFLLPGLDGRTAALATVPDEQRGELINAWTLELRKADGNFATTAETQGAAVEALKAKNPAWNVQAVQLRIADARKPVAKWAAI